MLRFSCCFLLALITSTCHATIVVPAITYDGGTPNRPSSITGLTFANGVFNAHFDYDIVFGNTLIDQSSVTGSSDAVVGAALRDLLNGSPEDSNDTVAFISVTSTAAVGNPNLYEGGAIATLSFGPGQWLFISSGIASKVLDPETALVTFVAVPEASGFLCLGLVSMVVASTSLRSRSRR